MANPTWNDPIKGFFRSKDINSMKPMGIDLGSYLSVKENANGILERVTDGSMPCDGAWPQDRVDTFKTWVDNGTPES